MIYSPSFVFVLVFSTLVIGKVEIPDDLQEYINELHDNCLKQIGLTENDHKNYDINDKDPKMMCYMKCLMLSSKWMSPDETIQYDFIINSVHPSVKHLLIPALEKCRDIPKGSQDCEKAYNFNICLFHADPEVKFELGVYITTVLTLTLENGFLILRMLHNFRYCSNCS